VDKRVPLKDRRAFPRYPADLRLEVRRVASPVLGLRAGVFEARCVDLSRVGARFFTRECFHPGEKPVLVFRRADGGMELACEIQVLRSTRVSQRYEVAGKVTRVIPVDELDPEPG